MLVAAVAVKQTTNITILSDTSQILLLWEIGLAVGSQRGTRQAVSRRGPARLHRFS